MIVIALKMLLADRAKYAGLLFGVTFTAFLVTFAAAYLGGMMTRSFALVAETPADVWVMDPAVQAVDQTANLPDAALTRVRSIPGVRSAVPLVLATTNVRFPNGRFQSVQVIGVDDASLSGLPPLRAGVPATALRRPDAAVVDDGGTTGKLQTPARAADRWPWDGPHLQAPLRPLAAGDDLRLNDARILIVGRARALPRFPPRPLLYVTSANVQRLLPPERRRITFVLVNTQPAVDPRAVAARIERATGLRARTADDFKADTVRWMMANSEDVGDVITMLTIALLVGLGVTGVMMFLFTTENLRHYAILGAMGATARQLTGIVLAQTGLAALTGAGLGIGLCTIAGRIFTAFDFPYRLLWFAPVLGGTAVALVSLVATAFSLRPLFTVQLSSIIGNR